MTYFLVQIFSHNSPWEYFFQLINVFRSHPSVINVGTLIVITIFSSTIIDGLQASSSSSPPKEERAITICTHDGDFHADEVLACYLLKVLYPAAKIIRTGDRAVYKRCEIVLDVGGVYDARQYLYDHHQSDFSESMYTLSADIKTPTCLSSAGLVYLHFGRSALEKLTGETDKSAIDYVYKQLYYAFIQEIDAIDNGVSRFDSPPSYYIYSDLSTRIARLNRQPFTTTADWNETAQFYKAMALAGGEFGEYAKNILHHKYPAREIVREAIGTRYELHYSGQIIELRESCPWKGHFSDLEKRYRIQPPILYVLFRDSEDTYRVQCVQRRGERYGCRKPLPESWRGLDHEELSKEVGIEGCIFVHASGFTAAHKTRVGALQMAIMSVEGDEE